MEYIHKCPVYNDEGVQVVYWITRLTGQCVYISDPLTTISEISGYISILCWLGAQLPQVVVNYTHHSVEGLSWGFLLNWFAGDFTNFLGCILTKQLFFQTALGAYYMVIDCILGSQYIYYSRLDRERHERHRRLYYYSQQSEDRNDNNGDDEEQIVGSINTSPTRRTSSSSNKLLSASFVASFAKIADGAPIFYEANNSGGYFTAANIGRVIAWICTFMYLTSRIPQIMENYRRKSTWGTSMLLFMSALTGNVTYTIGITLSPEARGPNSSAFLMNELPYLIGSAGTVIFDLTIFSQYLYYGNKQTHPDSPILDASSLTADYDNNHPHHQYPDSSLIPSTITPKPILHYNKTGVDDGGIDASTPLAMSLQTNYKSM